MNDLKVNVLKPDSENEFYLTIGELSSPAKASTIDKKVKAAAMGTLINSSTTQDKATAKLLFKGDIYKGTALFNVK